MPGLIALGGLLLYLETRSQARTISYVLCRRMGLTRRGRLGSLLGELGSVLGAGLPAGIGLAWLAASLVYGHLDVDPGVPPGPLLPVPVATPVAAVTAVAVIVAGAGLLARRAADRAIPSEVLRDPG